MAEPLKLHRSWAGSLLLLAANGAAFGAGMVDPTRPPEAFSQPAEEGIATPKDKPVLQSVIISPGRKVAIISGEAVRVGGNFGDSRLVKLTETEAVLRRGNEMQILKLFPQIEKRSAAGATADKKDDRRQ